jgi:hypothetical protein
MDAVTCQAVFQRASRHGPALSTPAAFADALTQVAPPVPFAIPVAATAAQRAVPRYETDSYQPGGSTNPYPAAAATGAHGARNGNRRPPPSERSTAMRAIVSLVIVLVLAAIGLVGWSISRSMHHSAATPQASGSSSAGTSPAASSVLLRPVSASSFELSGTDDPGGAPLAIDGSTSTAWHTDYYYGESAFGNLKKGTGLLLDMGKQVRLSQVSVQFGTSCCTAADIEIGNSTSPSELNSFTVVQRTTTAQGTTMFNVTSKASGRYVLIWLTNLPPMTGSGGQYEAFIYNIIVRGSAVSQSG